MFNVAEFQFRGQLNLIDIIDFFRLFLFFAYHISNYYHSIHFNLMDNRKNDIYFLFVFKCLNVKCFF